MTILQNLKDLALGTENVDPTATLNTIDTIECGEEAANHFLYQDGYKNLNHGSFGTYPRAVRTVLRSLQDECEGQPDGFIRYTYPKKIDESREAVAKYLNAPVETCVFIPNATTGVNIVLRNLVFKPGDVIVYCSTIYGACHKTIDYITETTPATSYKVEYTYPISDEELLSKFEKAFTTLKSTGKNPRICLFDTIVSLPGVRTPFESLTTLCQTHKILSLIDGAHSIGHIPLNLTTLNPDFYISNLHKWLHVPRGCAVFYCPLRHQALMRSSLPTSHGFVPKMEAGVVNPLPPSRKSEFVNNFEFTGTVDTNPYLCVPAALEWRGKVRWTSPKGERLQGEEAVFGYYNYLARRAGEIVSSALGTEVLENAEGTLGRCAFANVALPLEFPEKIEDAGKIAQWMSRVFVEEYQTFLAILFHGGKFWVRLSAQVYLVEEDLVWAAKVLGEVCERVKKGEWKS